jgi:hypothetical protein
MNFGEKIKSPETENRANVFEMETKNAFYDIAYCHHDQVTRPETTEKSDAVVLELISDYRTEKDAQELIEFLLKESQYQEILKTAEAKKQPIFLVDLSFKHSDRMMEEFYKKERLYPKIEALGSGVMLMGSAYYLGKKSIQEDKISRRSFLKSMVGAIGAGYLATPGLEYLTDTEIRDKKSGLVVEGSSDRKLNKFLEGLNFHIHPELESDAIDTRNDLIAQKSESIAGLLGKQLGHKPRIGILVGAKHSGIERSLANSESNRIKNLMEKLGKEYEKEMAIAMIEFGERQGNNRPLIRFTVLMDPSFDQIK